MSTGPARYQVFFPDWYDEQGEWEAKEKGWLEGVDIQLPNGRPQPLFFMIQYGLLRTWKPKPNKKGPLSRIPEWW